MPEVYPSYKIAINNPEMLDLNGLRMPFKIPRSLLGDYPWDPNYLDMYDIDVGKILKWDDLPDLMGLVLFEASNPAEVYVYIDESVGSTPAEFFSNWLELTGQTHEEPLPFAWFTDGEAIVSESDNTEGYHFLLVSNGSLQFTRFLVTTRNYFDGTTEFALFDPQVEDPLKLVVRETVYHTLKFELGNNLVFVYAYEGNEWVYIDSFDMPLLESEEFYATCFIVGDELYGKVYDEIKERPDSLTYEWYDYHTEEHYEWAPGEAPWDTSNPSIDAIEAPEKVISGETFRVEAATTDVASLEFVLGGVSYLGIDEGEGVFSAEIEAPPVTEKTSLILYAQYGDLIEETSILIYPALPVPTRVRFLQNGSEISILTMESGQKAFVDILLEFNDGETWSEIDGSASASIVSFDGESFEEVAICEVANHRILIEADLPVGVYYLQATIALNSPVALERVQRLKLKIVVDRRR